jgi:hypothetical protein
VTVGKFACGVGRCIQTTLGKFMCSKTKFGFAVVHTGSYKAACTDGCEPPKEETCQVPVPQP